MKLLQSKSDHEFLPDQEVITLMNRVRFHPIFSALTSREALTIFMRNHVYAVWDFMSLVKSVQSHVAPCSIPWIPHADSSVVQAINEIVLSEESDRDMHGKGSSSHFNLYLDSMRELNISVYDILIFIENVRNLGLYKTIQATCPSPALDFVSQTFKIIDSNDPLTISCWFAYGREKIIPGMFTTVLSELGVPCTQAPTFYYYLERHTELDGGAHSHFAQKLVDHFCDGDPIKISLAQQACKSAIKTRIHFWDQVLQLIDTKKEVLRESDPDLKSISA